MFLPHIFFLNDSTGKYQTIMSKLKETNGFELYLMFLVVLTK